jgi:hypothetical protein
VAGARAGGFYVAIHQDNSPGDRAGTLEAFPANTGITFSQFVDWVCSHNGADILATGINFEAGGVAQNNTYTTTAGVTLNFGFPLSPGGSGVDPASQASQVSIVDSTFGTSNTPMTSWPLASGTLLNADGQGKVTFHEPASALTLTLDLTDASEPVWSEE